MKEEELLQLAVKILDDHKATEIVTADVSRVTPFASHYILATAPNVRALGAFADALEEEIEKAGGSVRAKDGEPESGWIVIDLNDVVVHLFLEWARAEIKLDELINRRKDETVSREA